MQPAEYQYGFSEASHAMYDAAGRSQKARKVLAVLQDHLGELHQLTLIDLGCSTGFMTRRYSQRFLHVTATDIDAPAIAYAAAHNAAPNVDYLVRDAMNTGLPDASFDVATCTQIYEHVPDACRLLAEIRRVLRPGGVCFFAASNRLMWMEPHHHLPLLSVLPKPLAHVFVRAAGRGERYFETHRTLWGLRRLVRGFEVVDYTVRIIDEPERFCATDMLTSGSLKQRLASLVARSAYWACPTYIWLLKKPGAVLTA